MIQGSVWATSAPRSAISPKAALLGSGGGRPVGGAANYMLILLAIQVLSIKRASMTHTAKT